MAILSFEEVTKRACIKQEVFKVLSWGGEVIVRQLTIEENEQAQKLKKSEASEQDLVYFLAKCSMVEPEFFSEEKLKELNINGRNGLMEIVANIPLIGMTDLEKEKYYEKINNTLEAPKEELTKEQGEKK